jgi:hypothetical protein
MYTVDKRDRVRELTDVPFPSSDAPDPLVLADEGALVVSYIPATPSTKQAGVSSPVEAAVIVVLPAMLCHSLRAAERRGLCLASPGRTGASSLRRV